MLFRAKGTDYSGNSFSNRFEARSADDIRAWFTENGISANEISAYRLTSGPYTKIPWLILVWPILALFFCQIAYLLCVTIGKQAVDEYGFVGFGIAPPPFPWLYFLAFSAAEVVIGILIYNILMRTGAHYYFDDGRVIQITRGECVVTNKDDLGEDE
jgi:hypothetical protein